MRTGAIAAAAAAEPGHRVTGATRASRGPGLRPSRHGWQAFESWAGLRRVCNVPGPFTGDKSSNDVLSPRLLRAADTKCQRHFSRASTGTCESHRKDLVHPFRQILERRGGVTRHATAMPTMTGD